MASLIQSNFVANSAISEGQLVAFKTGGTTSQLCEAGSTSNMAKIFGVCLKAAASGDVVTYAPLVAGQIVHLLAAGSISAGNVVAIGSDGLVASASGNYPLNLVAVEAGSSAGLFNAVVTNAVPAAVNT